MKRSDSSTRNGLRFARPVLVVAAVATVVWVSAGQLNPPSGAISPTGPITINGADVNDSLPYVIDQPGSYILTSDIEAPPGHVGDGIVIAGECVTLDLNGFAVSGANGPGCAIRIESFGDPVIIRNGVVERWEGGGILGDSHENIHLENLHVRYIRPAGIEFWAGPSSDAACLGGTTGYAATSAAESRTARSNMHPAPRLT